MRSRSLVVLIAMVWGLLVTAFGQDLTVRNAHSMAYTHSSGEIYLFGGADEKQVLGDLWIFREDRWESVAAVGPGPRTFASMTTNIDGDGLFLFGGNRVLFGSDEDPPEMLGDTWEFRSGKWTRLATPISPSPRAEAASVYDPLLKRIVLFGGYSLKDGKIQRLGDTWEFRNGKWKLIAEVGTSPGNGAAMAFDPVRKRVIRFGGPTSESKRGPGTGETWVLDGNKWKPLEAGSLPNIFNSAMASGTGADRLVRFGGWNGTERIAETWALRDFGWIRIGGGKSPAARNHSAMVYDRVRNRIVLFGGHNGDYVFGDLWVYENARWSLLFDAFRRKRVDNGH